MHGMGYGPQYGHPGFGRPGMPPAFGHPGFPPRGILPRGPPHHMQAPRPVMAPRPAAGALAALMKPTGPVKLWVGKLPTPDDVDEPCLEGLLRAAAGLSSGRDGQPRGRPLLVSWQRARDPEMKQPKAFGFATIASAQGAKRVMKLLDGLKVLQAGLAEALEAAKLREAAGGEVPARGPLPWAEPPAQEGGEGIVIKAGEANRAAMASVTEETEEEEEAAAKAAAADAEARAKAKAEAEEAARVARKAAEEAVEQHRKAREAVEAAVLEEARRAQAARRAAAGLPEAEPEAEAEPAAGAAQADESGAPAEAEATAGGSDGSGDAAEEAGAQGGDGEEGAAAGNDDSKPSGAGQSDVTDAEDGATGDGGAASSAEGGASSSASAEPEAAPQLPLTLEQCREEVRRLLLALGEAANAQREERRVREQEEARRSSEDEAWRRPDVAPASDVELHTVTAIGAFRAEHEREKRIREARKRTEEAERVQMQRQRARALAAAKANGWVASAPGGAAPADVSSSSSSAASAAARSGVPAPDRAPAAAGSAPGRELDEDEEFARMESVWEQREARQGKRAPPPPIARQKPRKGGDAKPEAVSERGGAAAGIPGRDEDRAAAAAPAAAPAPPVRKGTDHGSRARAADAEPAAPAVPTGDAAAAAPAPAAEAGGAVTPAAPLTSSLCDIDSMVGLVNTGGAVQLAAREQLEELFGEVDEELLGFITKTMTSFAGRPASEATAVIVSELHDLIGEDATVLAAAVIAPAARG